MENISIPGFPPPEKQDAVKFLTFKKLPYSKRILLFVVLLFVGFIFQIITMKSWPGIPFLIIASILNLVKGYDSRANLNAFNSGSAWTEVDMNRIEKIQHLDRRLTKWDKDGLDISNAQGAFMFILALVATIVLSVALSFLTYGSPAGSIFFVDVLILIFPLWFNGIKRVLRQNKLKIKIATITYLHNYFSRIRNQNMQFKPSLLLAQDKTGKSIPTDVKFSITFDNMPRDFYGVQSQINLNEVQGNTYPYFYCVIPAKRGFGLESYVRYIERTRKITVEFQQDMESEVIVIRQTTTKTSGYHTNYKSCENILQTAIVAAQNILAAKK
ncbi:MAG: hypothetical protein GX352_04595 [Clostridiales bacterium]|nr:hypothetical protein [Clostridiales bacterium]